MSHSNSSGFELLESGNPPFRDLLRRQRESKLEVLICVSLDKLAQLSVVAKVSRQRTERETTIL